MSELNGPAPLPRNGEMHAALKEALAELLPDMLRQNQAVGAPVPQVPAPPMPAVYRPSAWRAPEPTPSAPAFAPSPGANVEHVRLQSDRDLDSFVRSLAKRLEQPAERAAIQSGRLRFALAGANSPSRSSSVATAGDSNRIDRGAVTERVIERVASKGSVLVLGPKAVLTPMGRDRARALGVQIQRETPC